MLSTNWRKTVNFKPLTNRYTATAFALVLAAAVALLQGASGTWEWRIDALASLWCNESTLSWISLHGHRLLSFAPRLSPSGFAFLPMLVMLVMPAWAMLHQMFNPETVWLFTGQYLLFGFGVAVEALQIWMVVEGVIAWRNARGNYPELPPLETAAAD